jgi:hypothetical protein
MMHLYSDHLSMGIEGLLLQGKEEAAKIGRTRRGAPVIAPEGLPALWESVPRPVLLVAVGSRGG